MKQETWWDYFDEDPNEFIGRQVAGAFGETMQVVLCRLDWAYLDWIEENLDCNIKRMFADIEVLRRPMDGTRDEVFAGVVRQNFLRFEKRGKPRPPWCPPADPILFDELEGLEKRK